MYRTGIWLPSERLPIQQFQILKAESVGMRQDRLRKGENEKQSFIIEVTEIPKMA